MRLSGIGLGPTFQAYAAAAALYFAEQALKELHAGRTQDLVGFHGARRCHRLRLP